MKDEFICSSWKGLFYSPKEVKQICSPKEGKTDFVSKAIETYNYKENDALLYHLIYIIDIDDHRLGTYLLYIYIF